VPDLLLVGALALCLPLAPIELSRGFHLAPFAVGLIMAAVAVAKIAGTFTARAIVEQRGPRPTVLLLLAAGAAACVMLSVAVTVSVFVALLLVTALAATGAWPLVVAAAQARVEPGERARLTVAWNAREYAIIAAGTAGSGWLLAALGEPALVFALAGLLFAFAAASAGFVLRRPLPRAV
jgi:MFS family permease